ncbi:MAG: MBL fold metallo-hydrolase [Candidatus Thorarchaeota archaeon]|nr:MBL fold metallo-hydrolase [Candidatus Thorarchaeota archaeon]
MFERIIGPIYFRTSMSFDSNIVFIDTEEFKILVDTGTGRNADQIDRELQQVGCSFKDITDIILTHSHIDHIGGVPSILQHGDPHIYLHQKEADMINSGDMTLTLGASFGVDLPPLKIDMPMKEGDVLDFGEVKLKVLHTPGHSIGSVCLQEERLGVLLTGDTMFPGGSFGRVDFPTGSMKQLVASLKRISDLDFEIALAGHMQAIIGNAKQAAQLSYRMAKGMMY